MKEWAYLMILSGGLVLLIGAMASSVGGWVIRAKTAMEPENVAKRALEIRRRQQEENIAEIGEATRQAIREAAERHRR